MIHQSDNHPTDIFTDNIKLDIHYAANNESMEIGMLISIRYDSHLEGIIRRVTYCQTNTIYRYRPFVYSNISTFRHLFVKCIFEREIPTSIRILYIHASSGLVHMSLARYARPNGRSSSCYVLHSPCHLPSAARDWNVPESLSWQSRYRYHQ